MNVGEGAHGADTTVRCKYGIYASTDERRGREAERARGEEMQTRKGKRGNRQLMLRFDLFQGMLLGCII